ncbi:MAG: terpene cyclase/mutase family protein [Rhodopirellula sp.]|nr:terpene cyclase/mutase family protein [Rhodopirellula sp.]
MGSAEYQQHGSPPPREPDLPPALLQPNPLERPNTPKASVSAQAVPRERQVPARGPEVGSHREASASILAGRVPVARPIPVAGGGERTLKVRAEEDKQQEIELTALARRNAPPWLISAIFHAVLMIVLGLIFIANSEADRVELSAVYAENLGDQLEFDSFLAGNDDEKVEEPVLTPDNLPLVDNPYAAPPKVEIVPRGTSSASDVAPPQVGLALQGREAGMKRALLAAYGGTATTEAAVHRGLEWLAKNQRPGGSWSLLRPYTSGAAEGQENEAAATAMALLAFQGAGNTHRFGEFQRVVADGWQWLLKQQGADGCFFQRGLYHSRFYTQGQCTIALCELYGMTADQALREPAQRAIEYILNSQSSEGGWRYIPQSDSDVSVTGWILMAMQSARMAGLEVPDENFRRVERFLDKVALEGGSQYPYRRGEEARLSMTAEGLLCRQYLGWKQSDPRLIEGMRWITSPENLIDFNKDRDAYYWYYATQAAHHMEGDYWKRWNEVMRQALPEQQIKRGKEAGSWDPLKPTRDRYEANGGRLYVTCLHIYMLEVYYRHLPLYAKISSFLQTTP